MAIISSFAIYTDLDGTLLHERTYSSSEARPALQKLLERRVPVVICSSKTSAEIVEIQKELDLVDQPFIVENGGAIYVPCHAESIHMSGSIRRGRFEVLEFGIPYGRLVELLDGLSREVGVPVRGFHHMNLDEIASLCSLPREAAHRAMQREYDEPFLIDSQAPEDKKRLRERAREIGLRIVHGGRFFHLLGQHDKGDPVAVLTRAYRAKYGAMRTYGLGNSENDVSLLRAVDHGFIIAQSDGSYDSVLTESVPQAERIRKAGGGGWRQAIEQIVSFEDNHIRSRV